MTAVAENATRRSIKRWVPLATWTGLTIALVIGGQSLPWRHAADQMRQAAPSWLLVALLANFAILPLWATEWRLLVPGAVRMPYTRMCEVVAVTAAVLNSIPFFAGEVSAVALLMSRGGLARGAALSVLAMDQLLVGFAKLSVLAVTALTAPIPDWLRAGILSLVGAVTLLATVLVLLAYRWTHLRDRLLTQPSRVRRAIASVAAWGVHFDALRERRRALGVASLALGKKGAELLAIVAIQVAFGLEPSVAMGLLVLSALAITTLLPLAPANFGVYEGTVFTAYVYAGVPADVALGLAVLQHLCFLLPPLATGYVVLTMRQVRRDQRLAP